MTPIKNKKILLVEPDFPIPAKSRNHKNFLPIGLLRIATYLEATGNKVYLFRGVPKNNSDMEEVGKFSPDEIWITSLFTYWSGYVRKAVQYYRSLFPNAKIIVGGVYASLRPANEVKLYTGCDEVYQGIIPEAESLFPAYDLIKETNPHPLDYQIIHASRGCERHCKFCGTWKIEPQFIPERSVKDKIKYGKIVFYDNNLLANPHIQNILQELIELKEQKKISWCESQSGFDGRILRKNIHLAKMIKKAGFRNPRIAWDGKYDVHPQIKEQVDLLKSAGYSSKDIYVFIIYNWDIPFEDIEKKRLKCWEWKVQISDCRFRPLDQLYDNYIPIRKGQTSADYYIHTRAGWTDELIKQFRRNVREQNICVRQGVPFFSKRLETKQVDKQIYKEIKSLTSRKEKEMTLNELGIRYWFPGEIRYP
jgi:hypothetical protein